VGLWAAARRRRRRGPSAGAAALDGARPGRSDSSTRADCTCVKLHHGTGFFF
jgi:hypothetical protein